MLVKRPRPGRQKRGAVLYLSEGSFLPSSFGSGQGLVPEIFVSLDRS